MPDGVILVCMRVEDMPYEPIDSKVYECGSCHADVWIRDSSWRAIKPEHRDDLKIMCAICALERMKSEPVIDLQLPNSEQIEELRAERLQDMIDRIKRKEGLN